MSLKSIIKNIFSKDKLKYEKLEEEPTIKKTTYKKQKKTSVEDEMMTSKVVKDPRSDYIIFMYK